MRIETIIVNDFYENPEEVTNYAQSLQYYNPWANNERGSSSPDDMKNAKWHASFFKPASECPFKSSRSFIKSLEEITSEEMDLEHWNAGFPENPLDGGVISPRPDLKEPSKRASWDNIDGKSSCRWNCVFHVKFSAQPLGTGVHNHVTDTWNSVGADGWAGLIYLNPDAPRDSGLKTFNNKFGNNYEWYTEPNRWQLLDDYANVYNRLILVRGSVPHVGGSGFGDSIKNGRFYQTLFFKTKKVKTINPFSVTF